MERVKRIFIRKEYITLQLGESQFIPISMLDRDLLKEALAVKVEKGRHPQILEAEK